MNVSSPNADNQLLQRIVSGERAAFEYLFNDWYRRLVIFAESYSVTRPEAEEIVSEAFVKFWNRRDTFQAIGQVKNWFYTVVRNDCIDTLRHQQREQKHYAQAAPHSIATEDEETRVVKAELIAIIAQEIRRLPEKYRDVMLLTYEEGLNSREIAERLGIPVTNVTTQRSRAIQLLKIAVQKRYPVIVGLAIITCLEAFLKKG